MRKTLNACLLSLVPLCMTQPAHAHAFLDHSTPKVGATLTVPPTEVTIHFDDDIQPGQSTLQVFNAANNQIDKKDAHPPADPADKSTLIVSLPPNLPPGIYKVIWHATCPDSHKTEGTFQFTLKPPA